MSKNKKRLWVFFIVLIYILIAIAGFAVAFVVKNMYFTGHQSVPVITPTVSNITPIPKPVNWKIYTSKDYKLNFAYPPADTIKSTSYGFGVTSLALHRANGYLDFQILMMPKTLASAVGQDFNSYYAMKDNTLKIIKSPLSKDNTTENFTKIRNRSVNGNQAIDYQSRPSNAQKGSQPEIGTFIEAGSNLILISTEKSNKVKLEKILSTFTYQP